MSKKLLKVNEGQYKIISDYSNRNNFLKKAREALYDCISNIAGLTVSQKIRAKGLDKMHLYKQRSLQMQQKLHHWQLQN